MGIQELRCRGRQRLSLMALLAELRTLSFNPEGDGESMQENLLRGSMHEAWSPMACNEIEKH